MSDRINILFGAFVIILVALLLLIVLEKEPSTRYVLLSFDVEPVDEADSVLDVLDVVYRTNISTTFFVTGKYAEQFPHIVKLMTGQEIACHGYSHKRFTDMKRLEAEKEIILCKKILKNVSGVDVVGFRAPYNLIDVQLLRVLEDEGFLYDASIISGLSVAYPDMTKFRIGEIPVSSIFGVPMEDFIWLHYLKIPGVYFYIMENKNTELESYLFHPHHIAKHKQEFEEFINHLSNIYKP
jgi:peptidoglycan/xylan/chitin deacetylase (PgdA/CDA1 family)